MNYDRYEFGYVSEDAREFRFCSSGPKGEIEMKVQMDDISMPQACNLSFGNLLPDGSVDDQVINRNLDRNKVLATVASAVFTFTAVFPEKKILFVGSCSARTRLYRMAIANNLEELSINFDIYGIKSAGGLYYQEPFSKGVDYSVLLIQRKMYEN
ncbi:hypothetical protein HHL16_07780 [Pseudoflavitalea sp. G-6-1-2]|uniref:DUF6934 family protein n=1 Tax=Pseudoflavitalea sp. G-6-1-2 TaxID=2728841 RepID=UPI00146D0AF0|nr:hypothetical protein [Pseudoflavitalea sp. G-6-1-2]NML20769.1 hypothetical protein [Pseudoflavitalea sp. G-6-1-2]